MKRGFVFLASLALAATAANASVLSWNDPAINYPAGATSATFNNVNSSGVNVSWTWDTTNGSFISGYTPAGGSTAITLPDDDATTAYFPSISGLWYGVRNTGTTPKYVTATIQFSQPVTGVHFSLWDIDGTARPQQEGTRIKGYRAGEAMGSGNGVLPSSYGAGDDVSVELRSIGGTNPNDGLVFWNDGLLDTSPPDALNEGWVTFNGPIDRVWLLFVANTGDYRGQIMSDITFVPEPVTMAILGLGIAALRMRRK